MAERMKRREFLKVIGVTGAGAATLGCAAEPASKLIPYLVQPEEIVPGIPTIYASVCRECPAGCGIHAKTREGRVVKLEGNPEHPVNRGRLCARGQAALQGLYNPDRIRGPLGPPGPPRRDASGALEPITWDEAEALLADRIGSLLAAGRGDAIAFLGAPDSGSFGRLVDAWLSALGARPRVAYDAFGTEALLEANRITFSAAEIADFALDEADYVIAFGAEFLETWVSPVEYARRFGARHTFKHGDISKFVFVGPRLSLTASNADEWVPIRPGSEMFLALGMARAIVENFWARVPSRPIDALLAPHRPEIVAERTGLAPDDVVRLAREFAMAPSSVAVPAGVASSHANATALNVAVNLLNYVAGNIGKTVRFGVGPTRGRATPFREIAEFTEALKRGSVELLLVHDVNPAHTLPSELGFGAALENVPFVVSFATHLDETAVKADLVLPDHHSLEAWGDHHTRPGVYGLQQPVMQPVFQSKATGDLLLSVAKRLGGAIAAKFPWPDFHAYLRDQWREIAARVEPARDFEAFWLDALRRGGVWIEARPTSVRLSPEVRKVNFEPPGFAGEVEDSLVLVAYPHPYLYDGRGANRPWLQELPDPMTRVAWNAWAEIHPETAARLGVKTGDVLRIESPAGSIELSAYVYRGVRSDTIAIPIGQGHTNFGRYATNRSATPLVLLPAALDAVSGARAWLVTRVRVTRTGSHRPLPILQGADEDFGREIAEIMGVAAAREMEEHARRELERHPEAHLEAAEDADPKSPYRWGMAIDLSACIGCNACVVACSAENNVPTVGEGRCLRRREMQWIRIDRYFEEGAGGAGGAFQTVHLPMLCQHCGNAPCEPVCPVFATYHNPEGLNVQVYNRCVGTRYCSNNCPYKVRRFNWFAVAPDFPFPLNLQLNPDVTVRDKGVMEKCTFCVQRINAAKNEARAQGRLVRDGEIVPACAQTCPTQAIVFGNLRDPSSEVSRLARSGRRYHVLEELNTRPAITYLKEVTHNEAVAQASEAHARHGGGRSASPLPSSAPRPPQRAARAVPARQLGGA